jgi:ABC-type phosphate transport system substrate-binding protein
MNIKKVIMIWIMVSFSAVALAANYAIIVHKGNPESEISSRELKRIFLGKKTTWPNGDKIEIAVLREGDVHKEFLKDVVGKSPLQFSLYWKRFIFTGTATPLKIVKSEGEMKAFIRANPEAVGYISVEALDDTVKRIFIRKMVRIESEF